MLLTGLLLLKKTDAPPKNVQIPSGSASAPVHLRRLAAFGLRGLRGLRGAAAPLRRRRLARRRAEVRGSRNR